MSARGDGVRGVDIPKAEPWGPIWNLTISEMIWRKAKRKWGPKYQKVYRVIAHYPMIDDATPAVIGEKDE